MIAPCLGKTLCLCIFTLACRISSASVEVIAGRSKKRSLEERAFQTLQEDDKRVSSRGACNINSKEKPLKAPFKEVNKGDGFVEEDWYEPRGPDSLCYYYMEEDVQYILRRHTEKRVVVAAKEFINLTYDSD